MHFETANTFAYSYIVIDPVLVLDWYLKTAVFQVVGAYYKYFPFKGKGYSTKESIQDGRTWERKRNSVQQDG
jgi:hypothetical protein